MSAPASLTMEAAIAAAIASHTLEPEDGWRVEVGKTEPWSGWRCTFMDRRGRPLRKHFLIYNAEISRAAVELAIRHWFEEVGR